MTILRCSIHGRNYDAMGECPDCIFERENPVDCSGCTHDLPGDCAKRYFGDDGYYHFPEGNCKEVLDDLTEKEDER